MDFTEWPQVVKTFMFYVSAHQGAHWDLITGTRYKVAWPAPLWDGSYANLNNMDIISPRLT